MFSAVSAASGLLVGSSALLGVVQYVPVVCVAFCSKCSERKLFQIERILSDFTQVTSNQIGGRTLALHIAKDSHIIEGLSPALHVEKDYLVIEALAYSSSYSER